MEISDSELNQELEDEHLLNLGGYKERGGVRATAVGRNAVLAGDPKCLVYYTRSKLNKKCT